jgi:uncharacterized alkaline shock family protein YloU
MDEEFKLSGLMVAPEVVATIVRLAAEKVEGVASVGIASDLNNMVSFLTPRHPATSAEPVVVTLEEGRARVVLHLTVLFGYPFVTLANEVRTAVADNLASQFGVEVEAVDVFIDALVFPKE